MKNKAIANILIGIIIVAILGVAGYFTLTKKPQKPIIPQTQQLQQNQQQETEQANQTPLFQSKTQQQANQKQLNIGYHPAGEEICTSIEELNTKEINGWKSYQNQYISFKYPKNLVKHFETGKESFTVEFCHQPAVASEFNEKIPSQILIEIEKEFCPESTISTYPGHFQRKYKDIETEIIKNTIIDGFNLTLYAAMIERPAPFFQGTKKVADYLILWTCNLSKSACMSMKFKQPFNDGKLIESFVIDEFLPTININKDNFNKIQCLEAAG